ncbi:MAG: hypothetical protein ACREJB_18940 [Planctomycetaceae bacterium]
MAEILWELKRADKVATFSSIAQRAGFSAGSKGRTVVNTLQKVRRGWPHLQWWRAIKDDYRLEQGSEHEQRLIESGYSTEVVENGGKAKTPQVSIVSIEEHLMAWQPDGAGDEAAS